jgi:CheY-like chemotaxis protein
VVEDDPADAFAMKRILAATPYQLLRARSIRQAQQLLKEVKPAAILLDIVLMGDESWRLMVQIRQQDASSEIPLIVMSSTGDERKAIHLGADEYLSKPVDGEALIGLLDRLTGRRTITRILLVDDEEVTRYLVRQLLPRSRYSMSAADNGSDGLRLLHDERPDVILLDINMPDMNGYQFLERLHDDAKGAAVSVSKVPVIVLTSAILEPGDRTLLHRASTILSKSELSSAMLIDAIEHVLHRADAMVGE